MSKLIIVCGLGGSGKTTLARELSKKLNIVCLHKDSIKSSIFDLMGCSTAKAINFLFRFAEEQISNGVDLIIEAPMNHEDNIPMLKRWENDYKVKITSIICKADPEVRKKRIIERERHICHKDADIKALQNIETVEFDYSVMPGRHVSIRTDKPISKLLNIIIEKI